MPLVFDLRGRRVEILRENGEQRFCNLSPVSIVYYLDDCTDPERLEDYLQHGERELTLLV